jgi:hypothetical protein
MGVGAGIFLMALGAIIRFAITADIEGVSLVVVGNILMIAGLAVALLALFFHLARPAGRTRVVEDRYVDDRTIDTRL